MNVPPKTVLPPETVRPRRRPWWVLVAALFLTGLATLLWPGRGPHVVFEVAEGTNAHRLSRDLADRGLIRSRAAFLAWVRLRGASQRLHAGRYRVRSGRSSFWIVHDLISGRTEKVRMVVPEGFASWQIAERLEAQGVCAANAFLDAVKEQNLEGYLFPATYELDAAVLASTVAGLMKQKFEEAWTKDFEARARDLQLSRHNVVTLASIVEREVRVREEGPMISAVYHNRLRHGMPLQADPTVQFALGHWKTRLTFADYRNTQSLYNTYLIKGLPPGPICSPGLESLRAALWPAQTDALYFVAQEDGRHSFSSTYREHTNKVNRRDRLRRMRK